MFSRIIGSLVIFSLCLFLVSCQNTSGKTESDNTMKDVNTKIQEDKTADNIEKLTYTVSMGVMPDNNFQGEGMLVGHVNQGKPAENAGILKGDVVVEMGGEEIKDLRAYTKVLGKFKKGDQTKVVVKRGDQLITVLVEF